MFVAYAFLTAALLSLWLAPKRFGGVVRQYFWAGPFVFAVAAGLWSGVLQIVALIWIAVLVLAALAFVRPETPRWSRVFAGVVLLALGAGLMSHQLPGFNQPRVLDAVRLSPDAIAYSLRLNFDKAVFGLVFLGICHPRLATVAQWRAMAAAAAPVAGVLLAVMAALATASSYVRFDPKFPAEAWIWMWANLFLTCVGEEALFRGFVQAQLQKWWASRQRAGAWLALGTAAILFGVAHAAGGAAYVALSTAAGVGYGWAYLRTGGRIEASILTHFALNSLHFFGFTYPALARP